MTAGTLPHAFRLPAQLLRGMIDRTRFAISTEETRYYLNGIYLHAVAGSDGVKVLRAVATDGHRLARVEEPLPEGAEGIPGVIIPRKTVLEARKLLDEVQDDVEIALSETRIQFTLGTVRLTSKLIDGTFPEYERVIPRDNDKILRVGKKDFAEAVARVSAISSERSRPVKLALDRDLLTLSAASPDQGTATEELDGDRVTYAAGPLEIGFQARYLNDITDQIGGEVEFLFSDGVGADRGARCGRRERALRADADACLSSRPGSRRRPSVSPASTSPISATTPCLHWRPQSRISVIHGPNGSGKTNLLEAISLLGPGRGLRQARGCRISAPAARGRHWLGGRGAAAHAGLC